MNKRLLIFIVLFGSLFLSRAGAEIIRLKNGVELHCEILACSEESGVTVKRLDNGGIFELGWEHILPEDVKAIKYARGYSDEEAKPVLMRAKRVWLRNGTYEDGMTVESDRSGMLCLRRKGKLYYFSQSQVKDIESIEVEAKEVYTLETLYELKIKQELPETLQDFFALGVYCESVTYYSKALELYSKVQETDAGYKADVLAQKIKLMQGKIAESDATAMLDEIRHLIYRKKYNLAIERIAEFETAFPESVQMGDKEKLKSEAYTKRHEFFQQKILTDYFSTMDRVAQKVAANREITLETALAFAAEEMGAAIRDKLAEDIFRIPVEEVEELWLNRAGGASRSSSYGTGTFILGPEQAKALLENETPAEEEEKKEEEKTTLDDRLKKTIEEIQNKRKSKASKRKKSWVGLEEIGRTPDAWWGGETISNRKRFLVSYYAEESGDMSILRVRLNSCHSCNGRGWLEQISTSGEDLKLPCEVCKTLGVERMVVFK